MDDLGFTGSTSRSAESLPAATDIELFCPHCDYNLCGLSEDRCPECGVRFNRQRLIRWSTEPDLPLGFARFDNADQEGRVLTDSLARPARLARELPPLARKDSAMTYGWAMRGAGVCVIVFAATVLSHNVNAAGYALVFSVGPVVGTLFCEATTALLLARLVEPLAVPKGAEYRFWHTLCACFSTYFPISCALVLLFPRIIIRIADFSAARDPFVTVCLQLTTMAIPALMILWWWLALGRAIAARGHASRGRSAVVFLVPVAGLVSVGVGLVVDYVLAMILLS